MPSLRFADPTLQARFRERLAAASIASEVAEDGSVVCSDEEWGAVNGVAHQIRDGCFDWYFMWCASEEDTRAFEAHLRANDLRYEVEHHDDRVVFLLPTSDQEEHQLASDSTEPPPAACSFCQRSTREVNRLYASREVAICDRCIRRLYSDLQSRSDS